MMRELSEPEFFRLQRMSQHELRLKKEGFCRIAGVDEAGRGPLAGPVVAAACILPVGRSFAHLNDSKQLSAALREQLYQELTQTPHLLYGIGVVDPLAIDQINILQATFLAMQKAVRALAMAPDYLLIDGNQTPSFEIPIECLVRGDALSVSIAAASILAKVTRDRMMAECDSQWPQYGFKKHKGYGTKAHLEAIRIHGPCPVHRTSFEPVKSYLKSSNQGEYGSNQQWQRPL